MPTQVRTGLLYGDPDRTIREARVELALTLGLDPAGFPFRLRLGPDGLEGLCKVPVKDPVSGQPCKVYHRPMIAVCGMVLIEMHKAGRRRRYIRPWVHVPTLMKNTRLLPVKDPGGYRTLTQHWGLIEEELVRKPEGGRTGYWRLTPLGVEFVLDEVKLPKYVYLYNNQCVTTDGPLVTIHDVLQQQFNYEEMMGGE